MTSAFESSNHRKTPLQMTAADATSSSAESRVMLLLPDGFDYRLTHRYLDSMPNTRRIMSEGYSGQILPFASTWGNINFASLSRQSLPKIGQ